MQACVRELRMCYCGFRLQTRPRVDGKSRAVSGQQGEAECKVFQVRGNSGENRDSPLPEDMLVAFHLLSPFVTCKYCAKGLGVPVTFNGQRKTCLTHRVSE